MRLLSKLEIRGLKREEFGEAMNILNNELKIRVRDNKFLFEKFKEFPQFFIGLFLDEELIGVICGFPRDDYLLISEIAIDERFQGRGFGEKLINEFEKIAKEKYKRINAGAEDEVIGFYKKLNYKPFLLIQFKKEDYNEDDFSNFKILNIKDYGFELEVKNCNLKELNKLRKLYHKANLQYIFTKDI